VPAELFTISFVDGMCRAWLVTFRYILDFVISCGKGLFFYKKCVIVGYVRIDLKIFYKNPPYSPFLKGKTPPFEKGTCLPVGRG